MKVDSNAYKRLNQTIKKIRKEKKLSEYQKWCESKYCIDVFYSQNSLEDSIIYNRFMDLKRRIDFFKSIIIPVLITIIFGITVTFSISVYNSMKNQAVDFLSTVDKIYINAISKLPYNVEAEVKLVYHKTVATTLFKIGTLYVIIFICLIGIAIALVFICKYICVTQELKFEIYEYEISKIKTNFRKIEKNRTEETKAILKIENGIHILKYMLIDVEKK